MFEDQQAEQTQSASPWQRFLANKSAVILAVVALIAFLAVCALSIALVQVLRNNGTTAVAEPTPFSGTPVPFPSNINPIVMGSSDTDTISMTVDIPLTLRVADQAFAVQPIVVGIDGNWSSADMDEESATWVYGTVINSVYGLADTSDNKQLLNDLVPGDKLVVTMRSGYEQPFTFTQRETVASSNQTIFAQQTPGITLLIVGERGSERLMVKGVFDAAAVNNRTQANMFELGEPAQLQDLQITVNSAAYTNDPNNAGFAYYLVDYQIQNLGLSAFDTSALRFTLLDDLGTQYATNPSANQSGNFPPLSGFLNANQTSTATAGFQIPAGLNSRNLRFVITHPQGAQSEVEIPFRSGGLSQGNSITLNIVSVSPDFTSLNLNGQVVNLGSQPTVITEADVSLKTPDGTSYLITSVNPPFPWTAAPGQTLSYSVSYRYPLTGNSAVFTIASQPFQLSNLE